jgi:hypothetical protein
MLPRAKLQCVACKGKCLLEVRKHSELLGAGTEVKCDVSRCRGSMRMPLRVKFQCIAFEDNLKSLIEARYSTPLLKLGVKEIYEDDRQAGSIQPCWPKAQWRRSGVPPILLVWGLFSARSRRGQKDVPRNIRYIQPSSGSQSVPGPPGAWKALP